MTIGTNPQPLQGGKVIQKGAPAGTHPVTCTGFYPLPPRTDGGPNYGPAMRIAFRMDDGTETGLICSQEITGRNATGKALAGMLGRPLMPNEDVNYAQFTNQRFVVRVEATADGKSTRVTTVWKA